MRTHTHLLVVVPEAEVGDDDGFADLLQRRCVCEELVVHALADSGQEADGTHGQVVLHTRVCMGTKPPVSPSRFLSRNSTGNGPFSASSTPLSKEAVGTQDGQVVP
eukprot:1142283-Pelagomonas_calceolata.AAC.2